MSKTSLGLDENIEGALCYLFGILTGIVFFVLEKDSKFVKFHAMQSILFGIVYLVISTILAFIPIVGWILDMLIVILAFALWLYLMYKAYKGEMYKIPYIGDIAEEQAEKINI
jgi:uncharacterized membrane protein